MEEKLYPCKITAREIQMIIKGRTLGFGNIEYKYHSGQPVKIIKKEQEEILDGNLALMLKEGTIGNRNLTTILDITIIKKAE